YGDGRNRNDQDQKTSVQIHLAFPVSIVSRTRLPRVGDVRAILTVNRKHRNRACRRPRSICSQIDSGGRDCRGQTSACRQCRRNCVGTFSSQVYGGAFTTARTRIVPTNKWSRATPLARGQPCSVK